MEKSFDDGIRTVVAGSDFLGYSISNVLDYDVEVREV